MIEVDNVSKSFGSIQAVKSVSFNVNKGEILGLLGPNGAGKTTLMRVMTGYLPATGGAVRLDGDDIYEKPCEVKKRIGYLPEIPPLYPDMTVGAYILYAAEIKGVPASERKRRLSEIVETLNLGAVRDRLIENISKGNRQRVGLAQAMIHKPEVLILDEPSIGLDPNEIISIRNVILELGKEHTVVFSTHILSEVSALCDRVVILNEGVVAAIDTQDELIRKMKGGDRLATEIAGGTPEEIRKSLEAVSGVESAEGVESVKLVEQPPGGSFRFNINCSPGIDARKDVFSTVVKHGWTLLEMTRSSANLEEVFLKLTTGKEASDE